MIDKIEKHKMLNEFADAFNVWRKSNIEWHEETENGKKFLAKYGGKGIGAVYKDWKIKKNKDEKNAKKLQKLTVRLLIALLTEYNFADDLFEDFKLKVNMEKKGSHYRELN